MSLSLGVPIIHKNFSFDIGLEECTVKGIDLSSAKWELDRYDKCSLEVKNKMINEYINDIKYIYENYIFYYISKKINSFDIEEYIKHEYDNLFDDYLDETGSEDPAWVYQMEFLSSGKSQDEWSDEDSLKCKELTKSFQDKYFPYKKIKNKILQTIDKNRLVYKEVICKYFSKNTVNINVDKEIFPISLEELVNENTNITKFFKKFKLFIDTEIDLQGIQNYGETIYYKNDDFKLSIILRDELFLEFIIYHNGYSKRVNLYDGNYFWFGWLVGQKKTREYNIKEALSKLESILKSIY